jgi:hypothetical protein
VAELADAYGSGPYGETRGGSSPLASKRPFAIDPQQAANRILECSFLILTYFDEALLLAAHRAFISSDNFLLPAGVSLPRFLLEPAVLLPPDFLLAAQRAFMSWESFRRPAGVRRPFFFAGVADVPPLSLAQRALAAAASFARVEGEK